jgi:energy-coupling factor transporter ATP-binding protein EcfA2
MPRIEEVQLVHWGSLRPDPLPLLVGGINVATGPNGSGKTCFLDAIKLLLGVTSFAPGRSSDRYIFDGGPGGTPAERAFLRATFANPVLPERGGRLFAMADGRLADAERVSVVCLVTRESRRYRILPDLVRWGFEQPLADDLDAFMEANPEAEWLGPRLYEELLDRTGITRALREVLALPQGAIDRTMDEQPAGLLAKLLELTGEGALLAEVEARRERADDARTAYLAAIEAARAEQDRLDELQGHAGRHLEWAGLRERLDLLRDLARPAAEHRDVAVRVEAVRSERESVSEGIGGDRTTLAELGVQVPALEVKATELAGQAQALADRLVETREARAALELRLATVDARAEEAQASTVRMASLAGERTTEQAEAEVQAAESSLSTVLARRQEIGAALAGCEARIALVGGGGVATPPEVTAFKARLAEAGIDALVVAEVLELADHAAGDATRARAEAALGDALWALLVPSHSYREATALAVEAGYRWPIARGGAGDPRAALTGVLGPVELGLLLEREDAQAAHDAAQAHSLAARGLAAVAPDGMRYGDSISRLQAPAQPVLGARARELQLFQLRAEATKLGEEAAELDVAATELRAAWQRAMQVLEAVRTLPDLQAQVEEAETDRKEAAGMERSALAERERALTGDLRQLDERRGAANAELALARGRQAELETRLARRLPELAELDGRLAGLEMELAERPLSAEQRALLDAGDLPGTESVVRDIDWLDGQVKDQQRFPAEVREAELLVRRETQSGAVEEASRLAERRKLELDDQLGLVEQARRRFEEGVREAVQQLSAEFARVCQTAGVEGELRLLAGDRPEEYGVDVLVAHRPGDRKRSYRDAAHSGGQRATIAILLLLATMGTADAADLLIMDEHIAHLDSTNIDHVAAVMHALADRVQFVLATPTNAESLRLSWCDLQLAFLPRDPGRAYSPPIRLLSRLGVGDLEERVPERELSAP